MPNENLFNFFSGLSAGRKDIYGKYLNQEAYDANNRISDQITNFQEASKAQELADKQRNFNVNSITSLSLTAGKDSSYAADLYNRIEGIETLDQYNSIYKELKDLKEQGKDQKYLFDLLELGEDLVQGYGFATKGDEGGLFNSANRPENLLRQDKLDFETISRISTPSELFGYAAKYLNTKKAIEDAKKLDLNRLVQDVNSIQNISTDKNAFNSYLSGILEEKFNTVGSDFYREVDPTVDEWQDYSGDTPWKRDASKEGSTAYVESFRKALRETVNISPESKKDRYFKYDLEKEHLGKAKYAIGLGIQDLNLKLEQFKDSDGNYDIDNPEYKAIIDQKKSYVDSLKKLATREENLNTLYGVEKGATSGSLRSLMASLRNAYPSDIVGTGGMDAMGLLAKRAFYTPEVVDYDKFGNAVLSTDFLIKGEEGTSYNWGGLFESGATIVGDMLPILTAGKATGHALSQAANLGYKGASKTLQAYDRLNKIKAPVIGELQLADRLSTFALVTANVYPKMVAEEVKWGGDYKTRAWAHSINEGLTEGIGFPDIGGLKVKGYTRTLGGSVRTAAGLELTRAQLLQNYLRGGADLVKNIGKFNLLESLEEEMALFGEYLLSNQIFEDEYNRVGRDKTEFNQESVLETLGESFKAGLLYSGLNAGMRHYAITRRDYMQDVANYEAANNPELFRAQLKDEYDKGKITEQQFREGLYRVEELKSVYESIPTLDNLRILPTFMKDEDARFSLFTNAVKRNDLLNIDYENLSEEDKQELSNFKAFSTAVERAQKKYDETKVRLAELTDKIEKEEATPEEVIEHAILQNLGLELNQLRKVQVSRKELDNQTVERLRAQNLLFEEDFNFTEEDINKIIEGIETDIINTEKRAFKFAAMSKEQKDEYINNLYNEKINSIQEESNPEAIAQSYSNLRKDIEELEKLDDAQYDRVLRRKQELKEAYGNRFEELTGKTLDQEYSNFEESLRQVDIQEFIEKGDFKGILDFLSKIKLNQDHISQDLFKILQENVNLALADMINNINQSQGETRMNLLNNAFESLVNMDRATYFNLNQLNEYLKKLNDQISANVTQEEFEVLRNNYITKRGIQRSQSLVQTGSYDNSDVAIEQTSSESQEPDDLTNIARNHSIASDETDESGNSEKRETQNEYFNRITSNKTPAEIAQVLKNRINVFFNKNSNRARTLRAVLDKYLADKNKDNFTKAIAKIKSEIAEEIANLSQVSPNSFRLSRLQDALSEIDLWEKTANKIVLQNPTTDFNTSSEKNVKDQDGNPVEEVEEEDFPSMEEMKNTQEAIPTKIINGLEKLDAIDKARRSRLVELASPNRTAAIEVDEKNQKSNDPAVVRRVNFLNELAEQDFKAKVLNRRQFIREVLSQKFPEKSDQEIEEDLKTIDSFFKTGKSDFLKLSEEEQENFLEPINNLLGNNFFDLGQIDFFLRNKGQGLITSPDVLVTASNQNGEVILKNGYPLELNFVGNQTVEGKQNSNWKSIPWRNSRRVERNASELGVTEQEVLSQYSQTFKDRNDLVEYLKKNDDSGILLDAEISEGVLLSPTNYTSIDNVPEIESTLSLDQFQIAQNPAESLFDKYFKFQIGRLYYNNNGNPVILNNKKISEADAIALAEIVYSNRTDIITPDKLDKLLFSMINQIDKNNRLMFFLGESYMQIDDDGNSSMQIGQLLKPKIAKRNKEGKYEYTDLTKQQFIEQLKNHYYKIDATYLEGGSNYGNMIPVIGLSESGEIQIGRENYLDYIKRTHEFPIDKNNQITQVVNKSMYIDNEGINKVNKIKNLKPATTPKTTQTSQPTQPTQTDSTKPVETKTSLRPKINNKFAVVPFNKIEEFLGRSFPMKEDLYDQLLIELEENPNKIKDIKALVINPQTGEITYRSYEETSVSDKYELALLIMEVEGKEKPILVRNVGAGQLSTLEDNSIVLGATKSIDNERNVEVKLRTLTQEEWSTPEATEQAEVPKAKPKLSLEELESLSVNDDLDSQLDESQKEEAKENKEVCKTGNTTNSKINKLRGSRRKGPDLDF